MNIMALSLPCAISRFHNKRDFGEHNNLRKIFVLPSVFTLLTCFLLCPWIHECNTFLLNPCVQHIYDTRLCTRLCKLLTRPLFFSTHTTCGKIFYGVLRSYGQNLLQLLGRFSSPWQGLPTISQAPLTTLPNDTHELRHLLFL